ncbi:MAG: hypothetical protein KA165_09490, partial [Saprospiraceae bacterium]|nr:hypothetical protein [Saprospiraceae bacterium]
MMKHQVLFLFAIGILISACKKEGDSTPSLQFRFKFDASQERLNNIGQPAPIPAGHAAQTPVFHQLSVHYIELARGAFTALGSGEVVYHAEETDKGGESAVDFDKAVKAGENEVFLTLNLKNLRPDTYEWVRASVTYQNYDIKFNINDVPLVGDLLQQKGTVASFVGFNTYINSVTPSLKSQVVNDDKKQGFWVFETGLTPPYDTYNQLYSGQAPAGATTVVN